MWLGLLLGCQANRIAGTIDGQRVPVETAFSRLVPEAFGEDDLLVVSLVSIPSACPVFQFWEEELAVTGDPAELAEAWAAAFPEDWWQVDLVARVEAGTWPPSGSVWPGLEVDAFPEEAGTVFASVTHYRARLDEAWFAGEADDGDYQDLWLSDEGAVQWTRVEPAEIVQGRFNTDLVDAGGDEAGLIEVRFRASPCPILGTVPGG